MNIPRPLRLLVCLLLAGTRPVSSAPESATSSVIRLWDGAAPGALGDADKDRPSLEVNLPEAAKAVGTAVIICPGGGYGGLAGGYEGHAVAEWFNARGVAAFVLKYRTRRDGYGHPAPLLDAQRALRLVRARAREFGVDAQRIGILGFSAGGHLASTAGTHFDEGEAASPDPVARAGCRPDFMILCYPVIALGEPITHAGSQRNLLGADASPELVRSLSSEKQVTPRTPPAFLFHTSEDTLVSPENSIVMYQALRKQGIPAELHIYQKGPHGVGLAAKFPGTGDWPEACARWLAGLGMLPRPLAQR